MRVGKPVVEVCSAGTGNGRLVIVTIMALALRLLVLAAVLGGLAVPASVKAQAAPQMASASEPAEKPLPDIPTLMREVGASQRAAEAIRKDYLYHEVQTAQVMDGHGNVKKTDIREYDVFTINGVPVRRLTKENGRELSAKEQQKENERIDKEVAKARERRAKADAAGKQTDASGNEVITASRFLELGRFSNPRRVMLNGRDTIAVDYAGDPNAKTRNRAESAIRDLVGTVWVDENDRALVRVQGRFVNAFKIGAGVVMNIQKDTSFTMEQRKVNHEVWLPATMEAHGAARVFLLLGFHGSWKAVDSNYRKFKATSTILPGIAVPSAP